MGRGWRRVALGVRRRLGRMPRERLVPFGDGLRVWADPADVVERAAWLRGGYEDDVAGVFRAALHEGDIAIDVGAHSGMHTVRFARAVGAQGLVVAFEPNPAMAARLARNLAANSLGDRVAVHLVAASSGPGTALLHLSDDPHNSGGSSLGGQRRPTATIEVALRLVDEVVTAEVAARVVAVKIDVEGHEAAVITGAARVLANRPMVVFEGNSLEAPQRLIERGFVIHDLVAGRLVPIDEDGLAAVVRPAAAKNLIALVPGSIVERRVFATHRGAP